MDYRIANLLLDEAFVGDKTLPIGLKGMDVISRIHIADQNTSVAEDGRGSVAKTLGKVEVVDGSDVLFSLDGEEMQAVNFYNQLKSPRAETVVGGVGYSTAEMDIDFGKFLWDEEFAFVPANYSNPQLKLTVDIDGMTASGAATRLTVDAFMFDEKVVSPRAFLMTKDVHQYTAVQSGYKYIELPLDYPIRQVFYSNVYTAKHLADQVDSFKLSTDKDKHVVYDRASHDFLNMARFIYPRVEQEVNVYALGAGFHQYFVGMPTEAEDAAITARTSLEGTTVCYGSHGGRWTVWQESANVNANVLISGHDPHGFVPVLFHDQMDPAKYFDVATVEEAILRIDPKSSASTSATAKTVVQQVREY